jgi:N-acetylneuraminate synthase
MENFYSQIQGIVSESATFDRIIILGKGGSLKEIDLSTFKGSFIININDSERFFPGHIALFHSPWVYQSIRDNGFRASSYITSLDIAYNGKWIKAEYRPDTYDSIERSLAIFKDENFFLTDFLLISAIKISEIIALKTGRDLDVYLLGFDFEITAQVPVRDFSGHDDEYKNIFLKTQRNHFEYLRRNIELTHNHIRLLHVGYHKFSELNPASYNLKFKSEKDAIKSKVFNNLSAYQNLIDEMLEGKVLIVAELTNNHVGDPGRLRKMIGLAKQAGADLIKVQKREVDTFYTPEELEGPYISPFGKTLGEYRKGVELTDGLMDVLIDECSKNEIVWFATVLDYPSLQFLYRYNPPLIKLPSTISNHSNYLKKVAIEFQRDLVVSTGFTDQTYEKFVLDTFTEDRRLFLLQTISSYPAPPESCQISVVRHYDHLRESRYPNLIPGYSSHDPGSLASMMAVAAGARMIEKHVKLGDLDWVHFDGVAIDLASNGFAEFVKDIRKAQVIRGSSIKQVQPQEYHKYKPNSRHN